MTTFLEQKVIQTDTSFKRANLADFETTNKKPLSKMKEVS